MSLFSSLNTLRLVRVTSASLSIVLALLLPAACARTDDTVGVSVSAINYTDQELNAYLFLSNDGHRKQVAGGEPVRPFEGGGMMCCISLPTHWKPGIKVSLRYDWWQGEDKPRQYITKEFEVPPYPDGQAGTLWALFYPDGSVEVVSSDFAPGHDKWPGKINGGPIPTLEYRRKVWQEDYDRLQQQANDFAHMSTSPSNKDIEESWKFDMARRPEAVQGFRGPQDPRYIEQVRTQFAESFESTKLRMQQMERDRP